MFSPGPKRLLRVRKQHKTNITRQSNTKHGNRRQHLTVRTPRAPQAAAAGSSRDHFEICLVAKRERPCLRVPFLRHAARGNSYQTPVGKTTMIDIWARANYGVGGSLVRGSPHAIDVPYPASNHVSHLVPLPLAGR